MSEQYPLLCDELCEDEERLSPRCRKLSMSRQRAKNQVKGAAVIITRWPGQWTTLLNYWWIGISMLAITTYLLYNSVFSYAMVADEKSYSPPYSVKQLRLHPPIMPSLPPKIFMHIFVDEKQKVDLNNYLPYIDIITKKYKNFKYQLIIVANDTYLETKDVSDQENNILALNSLWYISDNNKIKNSYNDLHIKYTTFSKYFFDSPLEKSWTKVPQQFLKFLVRAVSVWEKGGIAFDPIVLTPQSPNSIYIEKIYHILKKYSIKNTKMSQKLRKHNKKSSDSLKSMPNNILDVINALEYDNATEKSLQDPLDEVETKDSTTIAHVRKQRSIVEIDGNKNNVTKSLKLQNATDTINKHENLKGSPEFSLLPMFLKYLFHQETIKSDDVSSNSEFIKHSDSDKLGKVTVATKENTTYAMRNNWNNPTAQNNEKPIIISAKGIVEKPLTDSILTDVSENEVKDSYEVTIDLKGNIIATDTVCHAFIGGLFSNAIHYDHSETVTEFIIKELSVFCKGLLSSCVGIDVILL